VMHPVVQTIVDDLEAGHSGDAAHLRFTPEERA
jgi:hypothetical protein